MLNEGRLVEFDAPYVLLQKQAGPLYELVAKTGTAEAYHLLEIAKDAYIRSNDSLAISTKNIKSNISSSDQIKDNPVNHSLKQASVVEAMQNTLTVQGTFDSKNNGNGISDIKTLPIENISERRIANELMPLDSVRSQHEHVSSCTEDTYL